MKTCPNPSCKFTGIPDNAKFCPNCGTLLQEETPINRMTISECRIVPNVIKKGERCELRWRGTNVMSIVVDDTGYSARQGIYLAPTQSHEYNIRFIGVDGQSTFDKVYVTVKSQYIFGEKGELVKDRFIIIDLRQIKEKQGDLMHYYQLPYAGYELAIVNGEYPVKAYVAEDRKLEIVFDNKGHITEINFYPQGIFKDENNDDACSSIMNIAFGEVTKVESGWWRNKEYTARAQFKPQCAQYGVKDMTFEQWWHEHGMDYIQYLRQYQDVMAKHLHIDLLTEKIWEKGQY